VPVDFVAGEDFDAQNIMFGLHRMRHAADLDPYGIPVPFDNGHMLFNRGIDGIRLKLLHIFAAADEWRLPVPEAFHDVMTFLAVVDAFFLDQDISPLFELLYSSTSTCYFFYGIHCILVH
jgi:hypothetical protein